MRRSPEIVRLGQRGDGGVQKVLVAPAKPDRYSTSGVPSNSTS